MSIELREPRQFLRVNEFRRLATSYRQLFINVTAFFDISEVSGIRGQVSGSNTVTPYTLYG